MFDLKNSGYMLVVPELKYLLVRFTVRLKAANEVLEKQRKNCICQSNCRKKSPDVLRTVAASNMKTTMSQ